MNKGKFLRILFLLFLPLICLLNLFTPADLEVSNLKMASRETFTLTIGMEANYSPFNYTETENDPDNNIPIQGQSGQYAAGYDVEVAKFIAKDNGWNLSIVKLEWEALIPSVNNGTINAIIAGMSNTAERRQSIDFTDPYYTSDLVIIARENDQNFNDNYNPSDSHGVRFVTQLGTVEDDIAI